MHDLHALQGRWRQVRFEDDGVIEPPDPHSRPTSVLTLSGQSFHVGVPGADTLLEGRFELPGAGWIDWIDSIGEDAGKTLKAHYVLDQDRFTFAAADAGQARPAGLESGAGITLRGFVRI